jgi:phosphatidylinositol alpha-1,6-mannosyltransferase
VDLRRFNPAAVSRRDARAALGLPHDKLALGVVGQITPWKGHDDALRLVAALRREFPHVLLVIVGEPLFVGPHIRYDNRAFARRLQEMVKELSLEESVRFAGPRRDIPAVMRALDVLLAPSWLEPFGRVVVEAMAVGTPVIASDAGGPREIITDGVDGFLCPPRRPDLWVAPAGRLLRDAALRGRIGSAARKRASDFRLERHVVGVLEVHEDVLAQGRLDGVRPISIEGGVRRRSAEARPRVLVLTPDYPPTRGGIQVLMHRVVSHWQRLEPLVVTLGSPKDHAGLVAEYPAHRVKRGVMGHQADVARLNVEAVAAAFKFRPDAVLCGHIVVAPAAIAIGRALGVPIVQYLYAQEVAARPRLTRMAIRSASALIVVSSFTARLAASIQPHPRVSIIPPGVDVPPLEPSLTPVRHGAPTIITVARLVDRYKGHDVMLRALPLVLSRIPDARWIVVGGGPLRGLYERMADEAGVREHVVFRGEVDDVERDRLLDSADVFAMVSRVSRRGEGEGFGIVYLEAGAHGLPVVAGRAGGAVEAVIDGETGLLVDPVDHVEVASALTRLLTDRRMASRMGSAGYRWACQHAWSRISAQVESLLQAIATVPPPIGRLLRPGRGGP